MIMSFFQEMLRRLPEFISVAAAVLTAVAAIVGAFRSGALKRVRVGSVEIEGADPKEIARIQAELASARAGDPIPFEIEQLASYYSATLGQAKVSFWFSLMFASIGFLVIVLAAFLYQQGDSLGAFIKIMSGLVIDAVAALFFVQSRRAQEAMGTFFEKLRADRQLVEGRKICDEIADAKLKDNLKTMLVLHYSGINAANLHDVLAIGKARELEPPSDQSGSRPNASVQDRGDVADKPKEAALQ